MTTDPETVADRLDDSDENDDSDERDGEEHISVNRATPMRLRRCKARLDEQQPDCPDHTMDAFVQYLLDTERAARAGYYSADDRLDDSDDSDETPERRPTGDAMAASLLYDTGDLVDDDRDTHGDAVENQQHIARAWTWYLSGQGALAEGESIHGDDVAAMMGLLKLSRHAVGGRDMDHLRDCAGYAAIGGACMVDRGAADLSEIERGAYEDAHLDDEEGET